ncbi:MAG: ADOP family duplicated permease [Gemmatimonadales bacterium]
MLHDLRQAFRAVVRARGFTFTAAATLAVGIGAVTTLTSVLDMLLLRPPAGVEAPGRVTRLLFHHRNPQFGEWTNSSVSYPDFTDLGAAKTFTALSAQYTSGASMGRGAEAKPVSVAAVTGDFFPLLGTRPLLGRLLGRDDDRPDAGIPVAVLSERLWRTRFGGDPAIVGRTFPLDDQTYTVVGVAPPAFDAGDYDAPDLWVPFTPIARRMQGGDEYRTDRGWYFISLMARLAPGATPEQATAEATALIRAGRSDSTSANGFQDVRFAPVLEAAGPDFSATAGLARWLAAMSLLVLLIACANVANLMLARGLTRARELAIRKALGAGQGQLVRQLFLEGVLVSLLAGGLGVLLASWGGGLLRGYILPEAMAERFSADGRVFAIALGATLLAALASSLIPAVQVTRSDLTPVLKEGGRGSGFRRSRLRSGLVVAQVALSVLLVVGAGLFLRSLRNLLAIDIGYDREHIILVDADPAGAGFSGQQTGAAFDAMAAAARAHPGVAAAALNYGEPFGWSLAERLRIAGRDSLPRMSSGGPYIQRTTGDYFTTMGLRLLRGRGFTDADRRPHPAVAVIGATMARRYFPDQDPIGQCLLLGKDATECTVITGVAEDGVRYSPQEEPQAIYYVPLPPTSAATSHLTLFLRTRGPARDLVADLRPLLQTAVPDLPYVRARSLEEVLEPRYEAARLGATLFGLYAGVALLLAGLGLYSVLAYAVRGRTHELGIRLALGAAPRSLVQMVVGDGIRLTLLGAALGIGGALAAGRALASQLYGVPAWDPLTIALATLTVLAAALGASLLPARRAAGVDPVTALRAD